MGLLGFVSEMAQATIKVAVTPVVAVKDIVDGEPFENTSDVLESAVDNIGDAFDELFDF